MIQILDIDTGEDITNLIDTARKRQIEDNELKLRGCLFPDQLTIQEKKEKLKDVVARVSRVERKSMFFA